MTRLEGAIGALFTAFGKPLDEAVLRVYERSLADVPEALVVAAVAHAVRTRVYLPRVAEVRQDAETCRQALAARLPFEPCAQCRDQRPGWLTVVDPAGVTRADRCDCWRMHQAQLAGAGVTPRPVWVALPPGDRESLESQP